VFRGVSKFNLPGYVGFFQFLWNVRQHNACEQAEMILYAALDPSIARRARKGEFVRYMDHFDLVQKAINGAVDLDDMHTIGGEAGFALKGRCAGRVTLFG